MKDLVLEVETRKRIYDAVCKYPGTHFRELSRIVALRPNLVDYHLHHLEKNDLIYSQLDGQFKRYYPKDQLASDLKKDIVSAPDKPIVGLLRQQVPFRIVILLAKFGSRSHKELTEALHKSPSTVSHHLDKLVLQSVVVQAPEDRSYRLAEPARIERLLMSFTPHPTTLADGFMEIWDNLYL